MNWTYSVRKKRSVYCFSLCGRLWLFGFVNIFISYNSFYSLFNVYSILLLSFCTRKSDLHLHIIFTSRAFLHRLASVHSGVQCMITNSAIVMFTSLVATVQGQLNSVSSGWRISTNKFNQELIAAYYSCFTAFHSFLLALRFSRLKISFLVSWLCRQT